MSAADVKALVIRCCDEWMLTHPGGTLVQFAEEASVPYTGGLMRWRGRGNGPDAANLVKLLKAAGLYNDLEFSHAISKASTLIRRLEAGEMLPRETLEQLAAATERAGEAALLFADRLRREAAALG